KFAAKQTALDAKQIVKLNNFASPALIRILERGKIFVIIKDILHAACEKALTAYAGKLSAGRRKATGRPATADAAFNAAKSAYRKIRCHDQTAMDDYEAAPAGYRTAPDPLMPPGFDFSPMNTAQAEPAAARADFGAR
ncbi:MAG: hypothetical protein GY862_20335, partial [Gammaproteobacteria bacterium]|nr:hypothetical protein [Gammaproteobacteria bacterium]